MVRHGIGWHFHFVCDITCWRQAIMLHGRSANDFLKAPEGVFERRAVFRTPPASRDVNIAVHVIYH